MNALDKFKEAMNQTSPFWTKQIEVTAQEGEIVSIKCEGFCFMTDKETDKS